MPETDPVKNKLAKAWNFNFYGRIAESQKDIPGAILCYEHALGKYAGVLWLYSAHEEIIRANLERVLRGECKPLLPISKITSGVQPASPSPPQEED